jgi:hypothetical protein
LKIPKEIIKDRQSQKDRQHRGKKFEDPKGVIKDRQSQKDRQHRGQKFEDTKRGNQRTSITEGQTISESKV